MPPKTPNKGKQTLGKRKNHPNGDRSSAKRAKHMDTRIINTQNLSQAFTSGQIDVNQFVQAREYEIKALEAGMRLSKSGLSHRAFQKVPRSMRRRTASHNVGRVPKKYREKAREQMMVDRTPPHRKKISGHLRMRMETMRLLQEARRKAGKGKKRKTNNAEAGAEQGDNTAIKRSKRQGTAIKVRLPRIKTNMLNKPPLPKAKFRKRQIDKTWLPTHMYHTKRAHMTTAKEPLWRFAIPVTPTEKCYRQTHRASNLRGGIAWDMSYMSTIGLQGPELSLIGLLKALAVCAVDKDRGLWVKAGSKWRQGLRSWHGMLYKRQSYPTMAICPATVLWNPESTDAPQDTESLVTSKPTKRKLMIHIHPSAFLELWEEILRLAKVQKPAVTVEDLRYEIGSIEVLGPSSAEALVGILQPKPASKSTKEDTTAQGELWKSLKSLQNPSMLPNNVIIPLEVSDPRLRSSGFARPLDLSDQESVLQICASWPLDSSNSPPFSLFDREKRLRASQSLATEKQINRRRSALPQGDALKSRESDPKIPVVIYPTKRSGAHQGSWTVLLPWKHVLPVWQCLMRYPLSIGGNLRFGGLVQSKQMAYEAGLPWFPGDYPGTKAGMEWEARERQRVKLDWERRPKGRRLEYDSVDLGNGRKGEIGEGWACAWDKLFEEQGKEDGDIFTQLSPSFVQQLFTGPPSANIPSRALVCVKVNMLAKGLPNTRARIYRLPSNDEQWRKRWLSLLPTPKAKHRRVPIPGDTAYPLIPHEADLIGFVTSGNYSLSDGRGFGIGSVMVERILTETSGGATSSSSTNKRTATITQLCLVRDAGETFGRLAKWELV